MSSDIKIHGYIYFLEQFRTCCAHFSSGSEEMIFSLEKEMLQIDDLHFRCKQWYFPQVDMIL